VTIDLIVPFDIIVMRVFEAFLVIFMFLKSLYYLRLISDIAPLINIIFVIVKDIKYFLVVFIIGLAAFVCAFWMIGKNQVDLEEDESKHPSYGTFWGAFDHVYSSSLGEFDTEKYYDNPMSIILVTLFLLMSFFMCIHLLNMLIAMMGDSFSQNNEIAESKKKMSQLEFVVDNWFINPIEDKKHIVYILAAFTINEKIEVEGKIDELYAIVQGLGESQHNLMNEIKNIQTQLSMMASKSDQKNLDEAFKSLSKVMDDVDAAANVDGVRVGSEERPQQIEK